GGGRRVSRELWGVGEHQLVARAREEDGLTRRDRCIDQMHAVLEGKRPAVLDDELYQVLTELKGFRHLVRSEMASSLIRSGPTKTSLAFARACRASSRLRVGWSST